MPHEIFDSNGNYIGQEDQGDAPGEESFEEPADEDEWPVDEEEWSDDEDEWVKNDNDSIGQEGGGKGEAVACAGVGQWWLQRHLVAS